MALGMYSVLIHKRFRRLIADWSIENVTPDAIPYKILLDISVLPKKNNTCNKYLILIRLFIFDCLITLISAVSQSQTGIFNVVLNGKG